MFITSQVIEADQPAPQAPPVSLAEQGWIDGFHQHDPQELPDYSRSARAEYFRGYALGSIDALHISRN